MTTRTEEHLMVPRTAEEAKVAEVTEAVTAAAAQARAVVEARYLLALRRPRNLEEARQRILHDCERSRFAESALYEKPIGEKTVSGLSIRFVETALQHLGNVLVTTNVVYDSPDERVVNVEVCDLERNVTHSKPVVVRKTVERRSLRPGQEFLATRINARGERIYIVEASDDDLLNKEGALTSKALRTCGLRLIPGDILDEAEQRVQTTLRKRAESDPDAERKAIADAFAALGIFPQALADYLGHPLGQTQAIELVELRALYTAIRDGEATWAAALAVKRPGKDTTAGASEDTAKLRQQLAARQEQEKQKRKPGRPPKVGGGGSSTASPSPPPPPPDPVPKAPPPPGVEGAGPGVSAHSAGQDLISDGLIDPEDRTLPHPILWLGRETRTGGVEALTLSRVILEAKRFDSVHGIGQWRELADLALPERARHFVATGESVYHLTEAEATEVLTAFAQARRTPTPSGQTGAAPSEQGEESTFRMRGTQVI